MMFKGFLFTIVFLVNLIYLGFTFIKLIKKEFLSKDNNLLYTILLSLGIGTGLYIIFFSWIFFIDTYFIKFIVNYVFVYRFVFAGLTIISIIKIIKITSFLFKKFDFKATLNINKKFVKQNVYVKLLLFGIIAAFLKIVFFYAIQPITDADIINTYLPYSLTVLKENKLSSKDYFTKEIINVPPFGEIVLFSTYFANSGNNTNSFKFLTLPYLLGIIFLIYLFANEIFSNQFYKYASIYIFLTLPIIDSMLNRWKLYPDLIFTFLILLVFYSLNFKLNKKKLIKHSMIFASIIMGASILLKNQGLIALYFLASNYLIINTNVLARYKLLLKMIVYLFWLIPFIISLLKPNLFGLSKPNYLNYLISLIIPIYITHRWLSVNYKEIKLHLNKIKRDRVGVIYFFTVVFIFTSLMLGGMWFFRNYKEFGKVLSPSYSSSYNKVISIRKQLGFSFKDPNLKPSLFLSYWVLPSFGTFWLLSKIIGIFYFKESFSSRKEKYRYTYINWIVYWHSINLWFLGGGGERYLFPSLPLLSIVIVLGLKFITYIFANKTHKNNRFKVISFLLALGTFFNFLQSDLFSWLAVSLFMSPSKIRNLTTSTIHFQENVSSTYVKIHNFFNLSFMHKLIPSMNFVWKTIVVDFFYVLKLINIKDAITNNAINFKLFVLSILIGLFFILIVKTKESIHLTHIILVMFIPYLLYIFPIWKIKLANYSHYYQTYIYSYWGELSYVVPLLKTNNINPEDLIIQIGPRTGLAYMLRTQVINLNYGYGITTISKIYAFKDISKLISYLKLNNVAYIVIYHSPFIYNRISFGAKKDIAIFKLIDKPNDNLVQLLVSDNNYNMWDVFSINYKKRD